MLSEVAIIHGGGRLGLSGNDFVNDGFDAYGAAGLNGQVAQAEYSDQDAVILSSIGARCGKCFLVSGAWTSLANTQIVIPKTNVVDARFLWYQLNDERRWHRSGSAQPFIKPADVKSHSVWVPPLEEQRRIAATLDEADAMRAKRRQVLAMQSALGISIFEEMFGSERGQIPLSEIAVVRGGKRLPKGVSYSTGRTPHPYIRVVDIVDGVIETSNLRYIDEGVHSGISRYVVDVHDVVISIAGTIGSVASVPADLVGANLTENAARIVPRVPGTYRAEWLAFALRTPDLQAQIRSHVGQVTIGKLALFRIEKLELAVPSLEMQDRFLSRVAALREWSVETRRVATAEDELFAALQSRAFRGEL